MLYLRGHRLAYVLNLFPSELHIFVRPEIQSLNDLVGKKVNFNNQGTAAAYSGPLIFSRLGLDVQQTFIPHQVALEQMRKGDMAAVVFITSKPGGGFRARPLGAGLQAPSGPVREQAGGLLSSSISRLGRLPRSDQTGRTRGDDSGANRARRLQLAKQFEPL